MSKRILTAVLVAWCTIMIGGQAIYAQTTATTRFGALRPADVETAKARALEWLKATGKADPATVAKFEAIWRDDYRTVLDRTADTLALGSPEAASLLAQARDPAAPAPLSVPALLQDQAQPVFFRANLALAYGKALATRRVYEEALAVLKLVQPEQVVDPAVYLFHRAVAEHALMRKADATKTIKRLVDDVSDAPLRYKTLAVLMHMDMQAWAPQERDLGNISRMMANIERRLDLSRGGKVTQDLQKKVIYRLDELIKELEAQQDQDSADGGGNGGNCPGGGKGNGSGGNTVRPSSPANDSRIMGGAGQGKVNEERLRQYQENWGKLPPRERARALQELTRDLPPSYREVIEQFLNNVRTER